MASKSTAVAETTLDAAATKASNVEELAGAIEMDEPSLEMEEEELEEDEEEEEEEEEVEGEGEGYESSSSASSNASALTWISWFCSLPGHEYFCEVAEEFIEDDFNLTGLSAMVPFYKEAMDMVLDIEAEEHSRVPDSSIIESSTELLYGLIHQRFIITRQGLQLMYAKFDTGHFGQCPRVYCTLGKLLPCGRSDLPGVDTVKLYCPSCVDMYVPPSSRFVGVDGAFFGTTFAHLFFQTYPSAMPFPPANLPAADPSNREVTTPLTSLAKVYIPRIYGFKVSERARSGPRMTWLRMRPRVEGELEWADEDATGLGGDDKDDGERETGDFDEGFAKDDEDEEESEEEEEEEENEGGDKSMSTSQTLPIQQAALSTTAPEAQNDDERGRPRTDSSTLMNSRIYKPLPAPRIRDASSPLAPVPSSINSPIKAPPTAAFPSSPSFVGLKTSKSTEALAANVKREIEAAKIAPIERPTAVHLSEGLGGLQVIGEITAV